MLFPQPQRIEYRRGVCANAASVAESVGPCGLPPEGYRITVGTDGVKVEASDAAGRRHAAETLRQLTEERSPLRCQTIEDWPDFPVRAYLLDVSRCRVPTMEHLRRLVRLLARLKYNQLQLYTEHAFAYAAYPEVWRAASPMTPAEIRELDAFCAKHGIELVPNQNCFGHMERWLKHDRFRALAECPDGFMHPFAGKRDCGSVLCPDAASERFVASLLDELLPFFQSDCVHVGCDEPWELGQGRSAEWVAREGKHRVYLEFVRKLDALARARGKRSLFWADILLERPDLIPEAPADATAVIWGYEKGHPFEEQCRSLAEAGRAFWVAPGDSSWRGFSGRFNNVIANHHEAIACAQRYGAEGVMLTHWGDLGHHQTWPISLPGMFLCAGLTWNARSRPEDDLARALNDFVFLDQSGRFAEAILELGKVDALLPSEENASWPHGAFFQEREPLPRATAEQALGLLEKVSAKVATSDLRCEDATWLRDELALAIAMVMHALKFPSGDADEECQRLAEHFTKTWRRRSREGGLMESLAYF